MYGIHLLIVEIPWLQYSYPNYTPILLHSVDLWYHDPQVTTPVLKLFAELVQNRSQRLQFDVSSPNGILLFREASKVICSYGEFISIVFIIYKLQSSTYVCYCKILTKNAEISHMLSSSSCFMLCIVRTVYTVAWGLLCGLLRES